MVLVTTDTDTGIFTLILRVVQFTKLSVLHDTCGTFYKNIFSVSTSNILCIWLDDAAFPKKALEIRHFPSPFQDGISSVTATDLQ